MLKALTVLAFAGILFWVMPVQSDMVEIGDSDLIKISGKSNVVNVLGSDVQTQSATGNGNVQVGSYQWIDDHSVDQSDHKGANDQSGDSSKVQQSVVSVGNQILWGSSATNSNISGAPSGTALQTTESVASLFIGGF